METVGGRVEGKGGRDMETKMEERDGREWEQKVMNDQTGVRSQDLIRVKDT